MFVYNHSSLHQPILGVRHAHYVDRVKLLIIINNAHTIKQTSAIAPSEHADSHALGVVLSLRDLAPRASWRAFRVNRKATSVLCSLTSVSLPTAAARGLSASLKVNAADRCALVVETRGVKQQYRYPNKKPAINI